MCGITAILRLAPSSTLPGHTPAPAAAPPLTPRLNAALDALSHRGPDGRGTYVDEARGVGLGHVRMAVMGPDVRGLQPFGSGASEGVGSVGVLEKRETGNDQGVSPAPSASASAASGPQVWIVVNGEFYFPSDTPAGDYTMQSSSDSEHLLALYLAHSRDITRVLPLLRGEFAFILYDEVLSTVHVVRDRFGVKPLYYAWTAWGELAVSSEIKGLLKLGLRTPQWDLESVFNEGFRNSNLALIKGVRWLKTGCRLEWQQGDLSEEKWWYVPTWPLKTIPETRSIDSLIEGVRSHLIEAVRIRLRSDVPLGVYLSGGVDSSAIAGIIAHLIRTGGVPSRTNFATDSAGSLRSNGGAGDASRAPNFKCFTIDFTSLPPGTSELGTAQRTAAHLGVPLHPLHLGEAELAAALRDASLAAEMPFADMGVAAKFLLSKFAREEHGVRVVLTGEGSDEHFAGYPILQWDRFAEPDPAMGEAAATQTQSETGGVDSDSDTEDIQRREPHPIPRTSIWGLPVLRFTRAQRASLPLTRLQLMGKFALSHHDAGARPGLVERYADVEKRIQWLGGMLAPRTRSAIEAGEWHSLHGALALHQATLFPTQMLTHLGDRTEMAHALEARVPFLDHHLTQFVNGLPPSLKVKVLEGGGGGEDAAGTPRNITVREKWILYEAVRPFITDEVYARSKAPFLAFDPKNAVASGTRPTAAPFAAGNGKGKATSTGSAEPQTNGNGVQTAQTQAGEAKPTKPTPTPPRSSFHPQRGGPLHSLLTSTLLDERRALPFWLDRTACEALLRRAFPWPLVEADGTGPPTALEAKLALHQSILCAQMVWFGEEWGVLNEGNEGVGLGGAHTPARDGGVDVDANGGEDLAAQ